jgi:serine/threonine protein kinase/regulator of sirC expression with transglutaminase-like and TPR domain
MSDAANRAKSIFLEALESHPPEQWPVFLDHACGGDAALRAEVEKLLHAYSELGSFHESPGPDPAATVGEPIRERPGTAIGPYKLVEKIGEGGMGTVWMAQQTDPVKRLVALKLIKPGMDSGQVIARFEAERQALALMDHPNIARVFDGGTTASGHPYFVMELVQGLPLTKYCDEHRLPPKHRLELFVPVCQAIQHAHQKGIIHRDIKPSNVLVALYDGKPVPKVIDFGVAKATGQPLTGRTLVTGFGAVVGTLEYMSPEQAEINQLDIDTRSDIYSLGVLLYELLTGSPPFTRKELEKVGMLEMLRVIREKEPSKPSTKLSTAEGLPTLAANRGTEPARLTRLVRGELDWIVMKALEKNRNRRYETANGFAMDIQRYLADEPVLAGPPSAWYRFRKMARRNKAAMTMVAMFTLALVIAVAALSVSTVLTSRAYTAEREAHRQSEANLELTRKAIDEFFTKVSQSKLLDVPGLQPLRKDLLESAVRFQLSLAAERPHDPTVRADLAAAQFRLAILFHELNRNDDATTSIRSGLDLLEQLRAEHPHDRALYHRVAGFWRAHRPMTSQTAVPRDTSGAKQLLTRLVTLWEELAAEDPEALGFRSDLAAMYGLRSAFLTSVVGWRAGEADSRRSIAHWQELIQDKTDEPEYQSALAFQYSALAYLLGPNASAEETNDLREKALEIRERVASRYADVPQYQLHLIESLSGKVTRLLAQAKKAEAELLNGRIVADLEKLAAKYPHAPTYRLQLAAVFEDLAEREAKEGRPADALKHGRRALALRERLLTEDAAFSNPTKYVESALAVVSRLRALGQSAEADRLIQHSLPRVEEGLDRFPQFNTSFGHIGRYLGGQFLGMGKPQEAVRIHKKAIAAFEQQVAQGPTNAMAWHFLADTHRLLAHTYVASKAPAEAEKAFRKAIAIHQEREVKLPGPPFNAPEWAASYSDFGNFLLNQGRAAEAMELCEAIGKRLPNAVSSSAAQRDLLARSHYTLAEALAQKRQPQEAIKEFREAIDGWQKLAADFRDKPEHLQHLAFSYGHLAGVLNESKKVDGAEKALSKAASIFGELGAEFPTHPEYRQWQGHHLWQLGTARAALGQTQQAEQTYRQAAAVFEKLASDFPNEPFYRQELGYTYNVHLGPLLEKTKRPQDAERAFRKSIAIHEKLVTETGNPDHSARLGITYNLLISLLKANDKGQDAEKVRLLAIEFFEKRAAANPEMTEYRRDVGQLYIELRAWDKAAAAYTKVIELKPDDWDAWYKRGWSNSNIQQWNKAIADYSEAIKRKPGQWDAWFGRGFAQSGLQQWEKAIADYSEAIRLAPGAHAPWLHRASLYGHLGQWDKSAADYSKLLEKYPDDFNAWYWRGVAYANLKEPEKAIADLRQAIAKGFRDVEHLKTYPAFEPLHSREDFKKLLKDLETKKK